MEHRLKWALELIATGRASAAMRPAPDRAAAIYIARWALERGEIPDEARGRLDRAYAETFELAESGDG